MAKIRQLDPHLAELIAAGEVVERPASVVKELMENSIDAGAGSVTVEIRDGGTTFIRVTDTGAGIERGDVRTAFLSHATSKIRTESDLEAILSLGFRGEALASIAAVSKVELLTRTKDELSGTRYVVHGSIEQELEDSGCPQGTTIVVRDLFFNTPARMKFLRKNVSEGNSVAQVAEKIALAYPKVSVRMIRDGNQTLLTPGNGDLKSAVFAVLGRTVTESLIPAETERGGIVAAGFVSRPDSARANRTYQNFFINRRYVRSPVCSAALEEAFRGSLTTGRFPACVLNITMPAELVDVNVHPAKTEVRFQNDRIIFDAVYHAAKNALYEGDITPLMTQVPEVEPVPAVMAGAAPAGENRFRPDTTFTPDIASEPETVVRQMEFRGFAQNEIPREDTRSKEPEVPAKQIYNTPPERTAQVKLIGELFATYLVLEQEDQLILIDKHAAHERIIYERLRTREAASERQALMTPAAVPLSGEDFDTLSENSGLLERLGFRTEPFGERELLVREVPLWTERADIAAVLEQIAADLRRGGHPETPEFLDRLYHSVACKAAIKAGDRSGRPELEQLIHMLEQDAGIRYCPHGRPVSAKITRSQIEKWFRRG